MRYDCNDFLIEYIQKKIMDNKNFVIPRIAGVENNVAHLTHKINKKLDNMLYDSVDRIHNNFTKEQIKEIEYEIHFSGIKNNLSTMKNNAGIQIRSTYSLSKYSQDYFKAFKNCDLFLKWDDYGNVYPGIKNSHDYVTNKFKNKESINALVLDIFHYIHNPWTHALKGKRILIVSPFIESIKTKEKIRKEIYGVDLFPDCTFVYIKPPQTQGKSESREYNIELDEFIKKVEEIKDTFDVALCSCGGYGNIVVNKIYEMDKSAIYVGGVLQMYFGIYGMRWLRERKEVMQLYLNKHWSRPLELEKPQGFKEVEGSAYW
tara:strand:- start:81 stop:1031 length:951 start_codon:yes stop_codon:yes gene_type:complete